MNKALLSVCIYAALIGIAVGLSSAFAWIAVIVWNETTALGLGLPGTTALFLWALMWLVLGWRFRGGDSP